MMAGIGPLLKQKASAKRHVTGGARCAIDRGTAPAQKKALENGLSQRFTGAQLSRGILS
jgi:hypothetical protein